MAAHDDIKFSFPSTATAADKEEVLNRKEYDLLKRQIENSFAIMEATILTDDDPAES